MIETVPGLFMMYLCYTAHRDYRKFYAILLADYRRGEQVAWEYFSRV